MWFLALMVEKTCRIFDNWGDNYIYGMADVDYDIYFYGFHAEGLSCRCLCQEFKLSVANLAQDF